MYLSCRDRAKPVRGSNSHVPSRIKHHGTPHPCTSPMGTRREGFANLLALATGCKLGRLTCALHRRLSTPRVPHSR
eukprot:4763525-Prymnesium_polylepis.1